MNKLSKFMILVVLFVSFVAGVHAYSIGITGYSQTGCTPCHGADPDPQTIATITGIPDQYVPGETYLLIINVTSTGVPGDSGGFDLSVTAGTLSTTDPNAKIEDGEATHKNNNARSWQISWTAPTEDESVDFYVAGLASDGTGPGGDAWDTYSTTVEIIPEFPGVTLLLVLVAVSVVVLVFARKRLPRPIHRIS